MMIEEQALADESGLDVAGMQQKYLPLLLAKLRALTPAEVEVVEQEQEQEPEPV